MDHVSASLDYLEFKVEFEPRLTGALPRQSFRELKINDSTKSAPSTNSTPPETTVKDVTNAANTTVKDDAQHIKVQKSTAINNAKASATNVIAKSWPSRRFGANGHHATDECDSLIEVDAVQRKVKTVLNKLTPETFDPNSDTILEMIAQSKRESNGRTLRLISDRIIEMATDEAHRAPMYAKLCFKIWSNMSNEIRDESLKDKNGQATFGGNLWRKFLLDRCQKDFELGLQIPQPQRTGDDSEDSVLLVDGYFRAAIAKRRYLGLVGLIGELFKIGMLTVPIMHECIKKLLDHDSPEAVHLESVDILPRKTGKQLDSPESKAFGRMDAYIERISHFIALPDLSPRLKYILRDIVKLRKADWQDRSVAKRTNK